MYSKTIWQKRFAKALACGYGAGNIRAVAQTLTDKPVKYVINTHYHFDHTANDAYFDAAFMTKESIPYATVPYDSFPRYLHRDHISQQQLTKFLSPY